MAGGPPGFRRSVEAYGSWDVFPFIFNTDRSKLPVNANGPPFPSPTTGQQRATNRFTEWLPNHWAGVRLDAATMAAALDALTTRQPRVLVVLLGETDERAHERRYDLYLDAAHQAAKRNPKSIRRTLALLVRESWQSARPSAAAALRLK